MRLQIQRGLPNKWWIWLLPAAILPIGAGTWAVATLFHLPAAMNCNIAPQSEDTAPLRLYCAQGLAAKKTVSGLQQAIQLASTLPKNHALHSQSEELIEKWSSEILDMADDAFHRGDLEEAISIARKIPGRVPAAMTANERIQNWETIWENAETIYDGARADADRRHWQLALGKAKELLRVGNRYWETTQYVALLNQIQSAKEADDWFERQEAGRKSDRQRQQPRSAEDLIAEWDKERAAEDRAHLAEARELAGSNTVEGLEAAISEARSVLWGTEDYEEAQALIATWRRDIEVMEDQPYLDRASELASQGDIDSLRAAINEASRIPSYRTLYPEAQEQVDQWKAEVEELAIEALNPSRRDRATDPVESINRLPPVEIDPPIEAESVTDEDTYVLPPE